MSAKRLLICASAFVLAGYGSASADPQVFYAQATTYPTGYSTQWLAQIGVTNAIETQANGGAGFKIGFVDTGVVATQMDIAGRVSTLSSCAALTFVCPSGFTDDNGHGTATAAIGAGSTTASGAGMSGVAPRATIISEKVLNASGAGYDIDVANGITKAANAGAQVISLSLTYTPTQAIVNAINNATAKGAIIVFAGGNSATVLNGGANSNGLSQASLQRLVFVGSVNSQNVLSSFSNTPGNGFAVAGGTKASYSSLWLDAPGENIIAPGIQFGANAFAYWTGTSMAAPMVAGSLALLENTWPILARNGTATAVLFKSATDLGTVGVDNRYGNGLLNVTRAFQPIGTLTVTSANGGSIAVTSLTGTTLTSGALGSLSSIAPVLSHYTTFDSFQRNFTSDLSSLLSQIPTAKPSAALALGPVVVSGSQRLADGRTLTFSMTADRTYGRSLTPGASTPGSNDGFSPYGRATGAWTMTLTDDAGSSVTVGHGFPAAASFASALWGEGSVAANASYTLQGTTDLLNLAEGGHFMAVGADAGEHTRIGFSMSESGTPDYIPTVRGLAAHATALGAGVTTQLAQGWTGGVTLNVLDERNGLLGAVYTGGSALSLGDDHRSMSVGFSSAVQLAKGTGLLFNAAIARAEGGSANGLIAGTSPLLARSYGMALVQQNVFGANDHLSIGVTKPLRVFDGSVNVATTTVDSEGYAHAAATRFGIHPDGNETDFAVGYAKSWSDTNFSMSLGYRQDADNLKGRNDLVARFGTGVRF